MTCAPAATAAASSARTAAAVCAAGLILTVLPGFSAWLVDSTAPAWYLTTIAVGGLAVALLVLPRQARTSTRAVSTLG